MYVTLRDGFIEARQLSLDDLALDIVPTGSFQQWCNGAIRGTHLPVGLRVMVVQLGGDMEQEAEPGDWVVAFPEEFVVYDNDTFQNLFKEYEEPEPATDTTSVTEDPLDAI